MEGESWRRERPLTGPSGSARKATPAWPGWYKQTPGSVGYVELIYAFQNKMPYASLKNKSGSIVQPTLTSTSAAMNVALPGDMKVSLTETDAPEGYPIAGLTWILVYKEQSYQGPNRGKGEGIVRLLRWMTHEGQKYCEPMQYAPLSKPAIEKADALIASITYNGKSIQK